MAAAVLIGSVTAPPSLFPVKPDDRVILQTQRMSAACCFDAVKLLHVPKI